MTITRETRKAGPYVGDGTTKEYPFSFKVFEPADVAVFKGDGSDTDTQLAFGSDFSCELNSNQDVSPGGVVTLTSALESGMRITIVSEIPYLQETNLTNLGNFYPQVLNETHDKAVALIQQLRERIAKCVVIPWNSDRSPDSYLVEYENRIVERVNHVDSVKQEIDEDLKQANEFLRYTQEYLVVSREKADEIVADVRKDANAISKDVSNKATSFTSLYDGFRQDLERIMQAVQNLPQYNQLNHAFFGFRISDDMQLIVERSEGGDTFNSDDYLYSTVLPITARFEMQGGVLFLILPFADDVVEEPEGDDSGSDGEDGNGSEDGGDGNEDSGGGDSNGDEEDNGYSGGSGGIQIWNVDDDELTGV